jgi:hypothetical protein
MAPAPSPNACGLAAYRQLAGNLRVEGIPHGYWTSRKGNATRYMLWYERRKHAAPWIRGIMKRFGEDEQMYLTGAARWFETDSDTLKVLRTLLSPETEETAHWEEENIRKAEHLLRSAAENYQAGIKDLQVVADVDFSRFETKDADALQKIVMEGDYLDALMALDALMKLEPKDLDRRLADLFENVPTKHKELADGPFQRQLIFALAQVDTDVATEAIGQAIFFPGETDAPPVKYAISKWAAEIYWKRKGKSGKAVFVKALDSEVPHVVEHGLKYCGMTGDKSLLPRIREFDQPAAWHARVLLGDDSAWPLLFKGLAAPQWWKSYYALRDTGAKCEKHAFPFLEDENPQIVVYTAIVLSYVGTEASVAPLEKAIAANPENARLKKALADLKKRLEKE